MERPNLSSNIGKNIKDKWKYSCSDFTTASFDDINVPFEASCFPRNVYTCSFCKRRFKSAQALGGHMNVHRRERAKLRLLPLTNISSHHHDHSCPTLLSNPNPNPNPNANPKPNFAFSSLSTCKLVPRNYEPHSSSAISLTDHKKNKKSIAFEYSDRENVGSGSANNGSDLKGRKDDYHSFNASKTEKSIIRLDLEMGLLKDSEAHEDVDLELRLGYF